MAATYVGEELYDLSQLGIESPFRKRYDNYIGGKFVPPVNGQYFQNVSPVVGAPFTRDRTLDRGRYRARARCSARSERRVGKNLGSGTLEHSEQDRRPHAREAEHARARRNDRQRQTDSRNDGGGYSARDRSLPLLCRLIRAQEGSISQIDNDTVAYHFHEPLGVVGQIIPWNFPILMATWKLAPALAAGNCVVLKPAEQTPATIMVWLELSPICCRPGVLNIVNGFGLEAGKPLASNKRIAKIAFTGETTTGRLIMQYASQNLIPVTLELGGKSPNIFFADVLARTTTISSTRRSKASRCSRSIRARCVRVRRAR